MHVLRKRIRNAGLVGSFVCAAAIGGLVVAPVADAQQQSPAQAKCLAQLAKRTAKLAKSQGKEIDRCAYDFLRDGSNAYACLTADPKQKVARAAQRLIDTEGKLCGETPDFGFVGANALISAVTAQRVALVEWAPTAQVLLPSGKDECAHTYLKFLAKLATKKLRGFASCLKHGLADSSIQSGTDVVGCFSHLDASIDPKLSKILDSLAASMSKNGCSASSLPQCSGSVEVCAERETRCRSCQMLRIGDDLTVDCDVFDDGIANGSCTPVCGDGEVGTGYWMEECDDGNLIDGDGCDSTCTITGCGNGLPSPGEFCDAEYGASEVGGVCVGGIFDALPCAYNIECGGGYCTSCPYRVSCKGDCSGCDAPFCAVLGPSPGCTMITGICFGQACLFITPIPCDDPQCGTEGNCRIDGVCVPTTAEDCAEYEGVAGSCVLGS